MSRGLFSTDGKKSMDEARAERLDDSVFLDVSVNLRASPIHPEIDSRDSNRLSG